MLVLKQLAFFYGDCYTVLDHSGSIDLSCTPVLLRVFFLI